MSSFNFLNLTDEIRQLMLAEIEADEAKEPGKESKLYVSPRLNPTGVNVYSSFLKDAAKSGNPESIQAKLEQGNFFNANDMRQGKPVKMPSNAAQVLAQGEFNRYYIRAVCVKAIQSLQKTVEVYRARESSWSRPESEAKIGTQIDAQQLLDDLRESIGVEPKLLPDVNSGLSVKLVAYASCT